MSGGQTQQQVQLICDFRPDIIMVTPSYMLAIAEEFERQGVDPRGNVAAHRHLRRRAVDRGDAGARSSARLGLDALDIYGLSEVMGPGVASECVETKDGLAHLGGPLLSGDRRPESGEVLPDGERGRARLHDAHQGGACR